jgi:hypothetical protein
MSWKNYNLPVSFGGDKAPAECAILDVRSTEKGMLFPAMTTVQRDAINNKLDGLTIFNVSTHALEIYDSAKDEWGGASGGGGGVSEWLTATDYTAKDIVWFDEDFYKAIDDHTSGATFIGDAAHWQIMSDKLTADEIDALIYAAGRDNNKYDDAAVNKLAGIEVGATADLTAAEIKTLYESNAETNAFTDSDKNKLSLLESSHFRGLFASLGDLQTAIPTGNSGDYARIDGGTGVDSLSYIWDTDDAQWIENAPSALTDAEIKSQYENNADTNAYTDAEKTKLGLAIVEGGQTTSESELKIGTNENKALSLYRNFTKYLALGNNVLTNYKEIWALAGIYMSGHKITSLADPTSDQDGVNKQYADKFKETARDVYASFDLDRTGKLTSVTVTGDVTRSAVTSQKLNGKKSLKIEFGSSVAVDDRAIINSIVGNERCKTTPIHKCSFVYKYDGPKDAIDVVIRGNLPS